jgi:hypothetical protein
MDLKHKLYILHYLINKKNPKICFNVIQFLETIANAFGFRKKKKLIFIYGEPRSGTSFVTALIHRMGFYPGPYVWLLNANQYNPDGYFECVLFQDLMDQFIKDQGINFENTLPNHPLKIPKSLGIRIQKILSAGHVDLLKYNKFSLCADAIAELFPEAIWIHVKRNDEEVFQSNSKFMGSRDRKAFFNAYNQRIALWEKSKVSKKARIINFSELKQKDDVRELINKLCVDLSLELNEKRVEHCLELFRPKEKR